MRPTIVLALAFSLLTACEGEVLTPSNGFIPTACPEDQPNCDRGGFRIDSGVGTLPDSGVPAVGESDTGVPNGTGIDSGLHADAADPNAPDSGVIDPPDSGGFPDANGPPPEFLVLQGTHDVQYVLDLSDYLLGINGIAGPLDFINRAFMGRLISDPILGALVNPIIRNLAAQFVPPWFQQLVDVLSNVASFFERMEVVAVMNIAQDLPIGNTSAIHGDERWQRLSVQFISQCPFGYMDRNYPTCAMRQIAIAQTGVTPVGPFDVEVTVPPFHGVLQAGRPEADFVFQGRSVDMDLYRLLTLVLDTAISLATNGRIPTIDAALNQLIDCQGLADGVRNALNGNLAAYAIVLSTCNNEKQNAIDAITNGIAGVAGRASFDFDQNGRAIDRNGNHRADVLQLINTSHTIDGSFRVLIGADLEGVWAGQARIP